MEQEKVFMVQLDWSTDDDSCTDIFLFKNYKKAKQKFFELIEHEKNPTFSWAGDAFYENGDLDNERYELETNINCKVCKELFWDITDTWDYTFRTHISLKEVEVL